MYQTPNQSLTKAEEAVLKCMIGGGSPSNKEIAAQVGCSDRTVEAHLRSIYKTIGVKGRIAAALWAAQNLRGAA